MRTSRFLCRLSDLCPPAQSPMVKRGVSLQICYRQIKGKEKCQPIVNIDIYTGRHVVESIKQSIILRRIPAGTR